MKFCQNCNKEILDNNYKYVISGQSSYKHNNCYNAINLYLSSNPPLNKVYKIVKNIKSKITECKKHKTQNIWSIFYLQAQLKYYQDYIIQKGGKIMSDLLIYDKELDIYVHRFSCDCGDPNHIIDLTFDIGSQQVCVDFSDGFITDTFKGRIKLAFEILFSKKKRVSNRELIIRNEDIKNLQQVFIEAEKWFENTVDNQPQK